MEKTQQTLKTLQIKEGGRGGGMIKKQFCKAKKMFDFWKNMLKYSIILGDNKRVCGWIRRGSSSSGSS
jgi:hypothetical protein